MEITKAELKEMYLSMTIPKLMEKLGVSRPTIYKLLVDNDIKLKGNAGNKKKVRVI